MRSTVFLIICLAHLGCSNLQQKQDTSDGAKMAQPVQPLNENSVEEEPVTLQVGGPQLISGQQIPKIGVILGPGLMKTYAHIGVLQELTKAKIPIDFIVGLGWSAPIAALYAMQAQVFDAEWKMLKLDPKSLPQTSLLSSSIRTGEVDSMNPFLEEIFADHQLENSHIPFACPYYDSSINDVRWVERGKASQVLRPCMITPPFFAPRLAKMAATADIMAASKHLRGMGAEIVILINPLKEGELLPKQRKSKEVQSFQYWSMVRLSIAAQSQNSLSGVTDVIALNLEDKHILSVDKLREMVRAGRDAGVSAAETLSGKYGF